MRLEIVVPTGLENEVGAFRTDESVDDDERTAGSGSNVGWIEGTSARVVSGT